MTENIRDAVKNFKTSAANSPDVSKVDASRVLFEDGRVYFLYEPDEKHPYSFHCCFNFGCALLKQDTDEVLIGSSVGEINIDIKTDDSGNIIGLNPINLEVDLSKLPYNGVSVTVCYNLLELQVRYKSDSEHLSIVHYDGIFMKSGKPYDEQVKVKENLYLPEQFDAIGTTMQLLTMSSTLRSLRRSPFVHPQ
jgi:hypothetical protein